MIITIILFVLLYFIVIIITGGIVKTDDKKIIRTFYTILILLISTFFILFICYNDKSIEVYEKSLGEIKGMYYTNYQNDTNSIISNYNIINNRILFLQERIAHYQNNANHFASLWMAFLSLLFVIVTGFNLYNFNENKKELIESINKCNNATIEAEKLINLIDSERKKSGKLAEAYNISLVNSTPNISINNDEKLAGGLGGDKE